MSFFGKYQPKEEGSVTQNVATESLAEQTADATASQEQVEQTVEQNGDPLQNVDPAFAQEREAAQVNQEGDVTQGAETKTDVELPEGNFGEDVKPTGDTDVKVDAENADATIENEMPDDVTDGDEASDYAEDEIADREIDDIVMEGSGIDMMSQEIEQLGAARMAIESYGIDTSSMAVLQISGLLAGTSLEAIAMESVSAVPAADMSKVAVEALGEKVKEKAAAWAAKVVSVVKGGFAKVGSLIKSAWDGVTGLIGKLTSKAWDATKAAGRTIKAHPYKTIMAVVVAIGAVAAVVLAMGGAPAAGSKIKMVQDFLAKIAGDISKINWPFGKVAAKANPETLRLTFDATTNAKDFIGVSAPAAKLGWTKAAVESLGSALGRAWTTLNGAMGKTGTKFVQMANSAASTAHTVLAASGNTTMHLARSTAAAEMDIRQALPGASPAQRVGAAIGSWAFYGYVTAVTVVCVKLLRMYVMVALRIIKATLRALGSAVGIGGGEAEPAAA